MLRAVTIECATAEPRIKLETAIEDGLKLWLTARAQSRLDSQHSQHSHGSSSSGIDLPDLDLTTTTTTVGSQPKSVGLLAPRVGEMPRKSRYDEATNTEYAVDQYERGLGIKNPATWVTANLASGKFDEMIRIWKKVKEEQAQETPEQCAARVDCPFCYGSGMMQEPGLPARRCTHDRRMRPEPPL